MQLWVGLGNPGATYAGHRHNIGFMALDRIAADHGFTPWRARFQGLTSDGRLGEDRITLLKPQTFMNLSGQSVRAAADFLKLPPAKITVFHDELDLAPGKLRLKSGGGHAGHNGLRSIHAHLGDTYARVRLGIGHPGHKDAVAAYVLHDFAKADQAWLDDLLRGLSDGAPALAGGDGARFLNAVALRTAPPRASTGTGRPPAATAPASAPAAPAARTATAPASAAPAPPTPATTAAQTPAPAPAATPDDPRSALRRLADRFR
jgi:PTH1 family peptidyl-tRNA hydrolase